MSDRPTGVSDPDNAFWCTNATELLSKLGTTTEGLGGTKAGHRLQDAGHNVVAEPARRHIGAKSLRRLVDPLVAILIVAAVVSGAVGDLASCAIILLVIAFSIALEVTQEHNAEKAVEALKRSVAVHAAVRRDGRVVETPVEELVPRDVVELAAGDLVPADGIVLEATGRRRPTRPYSPEKPFPWTSGPAHAPRQRLPMLSMPFSAGPRLCAAPQ